MNLLHLLAYQNKTSVLPTVVINIKAETVMSEMQL